MDPNMKLLPSQGEPFKGPRRYCRLVGKLNYLTVTRPDITFAVSQFVKESCDNQWNVVIRILQYLKNAPSRKLICGDKGNAKNVYYSDANWAGSPSNRGSTSGYCVLTGGNLTSWRSKKQKTIAISSVEAKCHAMAAIASKVTWLGKFSNN